MLCFGPNCVWNPCPPSKTRSRKGLSKLACIQALPLVKNHVCPCDARIKAAAIIAKDIFADQHGVPMRVVFVRNGSLCVSMAKVYDYSSSCKFQKSAWHQSALKNGYSYCSTSWVWQLRRFRFFWCLNYYNFGCNFSSFEVRLKSAPPGCRLQKFLISGCLGLRNLRNCKRVKFKFLTFTATVDRPTSIFFTRTRA